MLCENKRLNGWLELGVLLAVAWCWALALASMANLITMDVAEVAMVSLSLCMFLVWGFAVYLSVEYYKIKHPIVGLGDLRKGLSGSEVAELVQFSPARYKIAALIALACAFVLGLIHGEVLLSSDRSLARSDAVAGFLYLSVFYLVALPVVASATRMPGSYENHFV
jgi:hypothetical protein